MSDFSRATNEERDAAVRNAPEMPKEEPCPHGFEGRTVQCEHCVTASWRIDLYALLQGIDAKLGRLLALKEGSS